MRDRSFSKRERAALCPDDTPRPLLELRAVQFRKEMFRERLVGIEIRRIDIEPRRERFDTGAARREFVERAEARKGFGFRAAYHR